MKFQRVKQQWQFNHLAIITLKMLLFAVLSNIPAMIDGAINIASCNVNCKWSKLTQVQKDKNCNDCCVKASKNDVATGKCALFGRCMCNIPGHISSKFGMPQIFQGPLCLEHMNVARSANNAKPLKFNSKLQAAAKLHTKWMIKNNCYDGLSIDCPGEPNLINRLSKAGYIPKNANQVVNVATEDQKLNCRKFVDYWLIYNEARPKMISKDYTEIGCYAAICKNCDWYWYITCTFGQPMQSFNNNRSLRKGLVPTRGIINKSKSIPRRNPTLRRYN